ncbi:hypothetical protein [Paractinoplanes durhamensis]|uniref:Uncharacterized protein n=2 Tax=Paractinoplanes durhamensis TaxID=113563 RepID=A0ABQ3Z9S0_9ACTN|nr:hypothetical protein [Actinoplanes durhamensis]GIE06531.1 hypothetical protein Adu01nite_78810 [Actinoplanes durhamensis]
MGDFSECVVARFQFLVDDLGFTGADTSHDGFVGYSDGPWAVWVVHERRGDAVETNLRYDDVVQVYRAPMRAVLDLARVGDPDRIRIAARTPSEMQASVESQAAALRLLVPVLRAGGKGLIEPVA